MRHRQKIEVDDAQKMGEWYWEGNVQAKIVAYLASKGFEIFRVANTEIREPGVDIEALDLSGKRLLITVKGFPTKSINTQARHWFSQAIFDLILYKQDHPNSNFAIGLPAGFATYENLSRRVIWFKSVLPFRYYWVYEDGSVKVE